MILAINTAQTAHELALLSGGKLLAEKIWQANRQDLDNLLPSLKALLEEHGLSKNDITEIVVVNGPGTFTSLRTGVAFANALAEGLHAKLYAMTTFELLKRKAAIQDSLLALTQAGGLDIGVRYNDDPVRVGPMAALLNDYTHDTGIHVVSELNETQNEELHPLLLEKKWTLVEGHELQTMGEALQTIGLSGLDAVATVEPYYLKAPHITKSSDKWKQ